MSPVQSIRNGSVLCARVLPEWFTEWHGTGSQDANDRAAGLPPCKRCEDQARREDATTANRRSSQTPRRLRLPPCLAPPPASGRARLL